MVESPLGHWLRLEEEHSRTCFRKSPSRVRMGKWFDACWVGGAG